MAGRFLFQKLASRASGSTSILCARVSAASARDVVAPLTRRASEGGIGALSRFFHGSAAHPCTLVPSSTLAPKHCGIHDYAAKYLNPLPYSCPAAKMSNPTAAGMLSHLTKPASADSVRGVKRTFSSSSSDKGFADWEGEKVALLAELEAAKATLGEAFYEAKKAAIIAEFDAGKAKWEAEAEASKAEIAAWEERMNRQTADFDRFVNVLLFGIAALALSSWSMNSAGLHVLTEAKNLKLAAAVAVENPNVA